MPSVIPILNDKYIATMDLYPQEAKEFNRVYQFYDNLREKKLTTAKCNNCGATPFPPRVVCPDCNSSDMEWITLPSNGKVVQFSEQVAGVPLGWETPLIHAFVDLGGKLKILTRIANCAMGQLKEGDTVQLTVYDVPSVMIDVKGGVKESPRVFFAFEPVKK